MAKYQDIKKRFSNRAHHTTIGFLTSDSAFVDLGYQADILYRITEMFFNDNAVINNLLYGICNMINNIRDDLIECGIISDKALLHSDGFDEEDSIINYKKILKDITPYIKDKLPLLMGISEETDEFVKRLMKKG